MSAKERKLFIALGLEDLVDHLQSNPTVLYRMAVEQAFCENLSGPAVDSLRRCYIALHNCNPYRGTPEWDAMIQL
jgi:hypothetical protein